MLSLPCLRHHHHRLLLPIPQPLTLTPPIRLLRSRRRHRISVVSSAPAPSSATFPSSAIRDIADKLRSLGFIEDRPPGPRPSSGLGTAGEIFLPSLSDVPKLRVGHTLDPSWSTPEGPLPVPSSGEALTRLRKDDWRATKERKREARERPPTAAEAVIGARELRRLRRVGLALRRRMRLGKAGITEGVVNGVHERWRRSEVVRIKCDDICKMNMRRTHELLERKTGGLVIWRSGSSILLYRGVNYKYPYFTDDALLEENNTLSQIPITRFASEQGKNISSISLANTMELPNNLHSHSLVVGVGSPKKLRFQLPGEAQLEAEADQLLDGLGPRFTDWRGHGPLPVDADLLHPVQGFRKPFRLLPFGVNPKLTDSELTILKRLASPLPCHFALGRDRNLQGLAASMIKLWERCEIAKIAVKRGAQNMNSELMANELKKLTGGTLLSRDMYYIVFYRGKDFLPLAVSNAIKERRKNMLNGRMMTDESSFKPTDCPDLGSAKPDMLKQLQGTVAHKISSEGRKVSPKPIPKSIEVKLSAAIAKKVKAEQILEELEGSKKLQKPEPDKESISQEERYMLRRIGLRMKPFLLLGRRGAFDGTVENMHLHWKYRELVKIISKNKPAEEVHATARILEAESGGILVALERVNMGYAIIMYRGKNYKRPSDLRPHTLLNKKEAHTRYLEKQRSKSLKLHILKLNQEIDQMKRKLVSHDKDENIMHSTDSNHFEGITKNLNDSISVQHAQKSLSIQVNLDKEENIMPFTDCNHFEDINKNLNDSISVEHAQKSLSIQVNHDKEENIMPSTDSNHSEGINKNLKDFISVQHAQKSRSIQDREYGTTSFSEYTGCDNTLSEDADGEVSTSKEESSSISEDFCNHSDSPRRLSADFFLNKDLLSKDENMKLEFGRTCRTSTLSNKERLILRKQALKMKNRPVLAVGKVLTGVAKTIAVHFRKHPLAIVNIKGIAKGTSIHDVIFELERLTGSIMVSREPNKVILYRGWGAGEKPNGSWKQNSATNPETIEKNIPPALLDAVRMETGLQN